jgi:membrane-associated phospholipid phosphatase
MPESQSIPDNMIGVHGSYVILRRGKVGNMRQTFWRVAAALILKAATATATAQDQSSSQTPISTPTGRSQQSPDRLPLLRDFAVDEWRMWSSPFRRSSYRSHTAEKYVVPFAILSAALIATDSHTARLLPNTVDQAIWSGRVSQIGAGYTLAGFGGGFFLLGQATGNRHAREAGWLGLQALAHSQVLVLAMKQITNRQRPINDQSSSGFWNGGDSFPSGHATSSFALATVFAYEYRDHIAVPIVGYSLAGLVSASRLSARRHWLSDITVGGAVGFLVGRFVYKHHHDPDLPGSPVHRADRLIPHIGFGGGGIILNWPLSSGSGGRLRN